MKTYIWLQIKRTMRVFPYILLITAVLLAGIAFVFGSILQTENQSENRQRFKVGIVGDTDNMYIELGKAALESIDSTRFSIEMVMLTEEEAKTAMQRAELSAYVVIPKGFVEAMRYGEIRTIQYVTTTGNVGISSMFKEEITRAIIEMLTHTQKGIYGTQHALQAAGQNKGINQHLNNISLEYADVLFRRSEMYTAKELGLSHGLDLGQYYFCGMSVLFLCILGLPYAALFVKKEHAIERVLAAKGCTALRQTVCEYIVYTANMWLLTALVTVAAAIFGEQTAMFKAAEAVTVGLQMLPVVAMLAAFNMLVFEVAGNVISGVLLQFFSTVAMCYVTGCFYPSYALPRVLQTISPFLPTGVSTGYLANCLLKQDAFVYAGGVVLYGAVFFALTVATRNRKLVGKR